MIEWVPDPRWRLVTVEKACRHMDGKSHHKCPNPAVAELNRGRYNNRDRRRDDWWWPYCAEHLYGHRIIDGVVCFHRLVVDQFDEKS